MTVTHSNINSTHSNVSRASILHGADDRPVFAKVVVITDRKVLDRQFEHAHGRVQKIDVDSGAQARIIITTLQKFPIAIPSLCDGGALIDHEQVPAGTSVAGKSWRGVWVAPYRPLLHLKV